MFTRNILAICVAILSTCSYFLVAGASANMTAAANSFEQFNSNTEFRQTYVMDDLRSAIMEDGKPFDERDFGFDATNRRMHMLHFAEYAFSFHARHRANFGLFVYLWNPSRMDIVPQSSANTIQMATRYDEQGRPTEYSQIPLRFLSRSTGNIEGLFYKFEIVLIGEHRASLLARLSENIDNRRYDISGIELTTRPTFQTRDFHVGRTYRIRGFARGHGELPNTESTLEFAVDGLRTLELDVRSTWYRTPTSIRGIGHQHQINTVYFSVPNYILEEYGSLQRIRASWHEFQTQPVFVTSRRSLYNNFRPNVGQLTNRNESLNYGIYRGFAGGGSASLSAAWGFNDVGNFVRNTGFNAGVVEQFMHYIFHVNNIETHDGTNLPVGGVSGDDLSDWIHNYNASFRTGELQVGGRTFSNDLFTDTIDSDRLANGIVRGHNVRDIDAGDVQDLLFYDNVRRTTFWERFWSGGEQFVFGDLISEGLAPIEALPQTFPSGNNNQLSRQLFVNIADVPDLRAFHNAATARDETVFLFRFAVTDYHARWLTIYSPTDMAWWEYIFGWIISQQTRFEGELYKAQQTVFLDFDIISLTFYGEFGYITIPVVSDPIDIIPDITPPAYDPPPTLDLTWWLRLFLGLFVLILLLVALMPFIPLIASLVAAFLKLGLWLVFMPFRILGDIHRKRRRQRDAAPNNKRGYG